MCGRFTLHVDDDFYDRFDLGNRLDIVSNNYTYSPGNITPIITREGHNLIWLMKWGLIPFWAKDPKIGQRMFNARSESVVDKPSFRQSFKTKRCLVPASGFFEWSKEGTKKIPYIFEVKDRSLFAFAGLYDIWTDPVSGIETYSYTIITTDPNDSVAPIHDRMPVILKQKDESLWLDHSTPANILTKLLIPSPEYLISSTIQ